MAQAASSAPDPAAASPPVAASASSPTPSAPSPDAVRLPAGTELQVELVDPLSSATSHLRDTFAIRLAQPITVGGVEVVAAGRTGQGEVIDAAPAGLLGARGKLVISARYLNLNGKPARIRGMTFMASGTGRVGLAWSASLVPLVGLGAVFIRGGNIEIPAGAPATVKLAEAVDVPLKASTEGGDTK